MNINKTTLKRAVSAGVIIVFFLNTIVPVYAQSIPAALPNPETMVSLSAPFNPLVIKGLKLFPDNPLKFDFIVDKGDSAFEGKGLQDEGTKLIKYFLAALTVPEEDMWVNLSPKEKDRIIPNEFGVTEMGRDMLTQDYLLKQLTSSLVFPESELGKKFWDKIYAEVGTTDIPTFNPPRPGEASPNLEGWAGKVWIMPEKAVVYENGDTAFIVESKLKVMLEEDNSNRGQETSSTQFIRDIILPEIEKEVNAGSNFAQLRQIYNSVILATWFKRNLKKSFLGQVYMDQNKVAGVDIQDKNAKEKIYQQYLEALKKGAYNYIKEDYDPVTQQIIPRKYFSGGVNWKFGDGVNSAMLSTKDNSFLKIVKTAGLVLMASGLMLASPVAQAESPQPVPTATVAVTVSVDLVNPLIRDMEALKEAIKLSEGQGFEGLTSISNASNKVKLPQDAEQREKAIKYLMEIVRNYVNYDFRFVEQSIELLIGAKAPDLVEALVNILKDEKISKPMKLNVVRYLVKIGTGDALRLVAKSIYEIKKTVTGMPYHTDTIDEIELIPSNQWDLFVVKFLEESAQRTPEEQLSFLIDRLSETKKSAYLLATALMDRYPNLGEDAVKKILNILDQAGQEKMESAVQHDVSLALSHLILLQPQYHETFWKFLEGKVIGDLQFANATVAEKVARINQIRQQNEFAVMRSSDFNVATLKALINDPDREVGFELYRKNLSQNPQSAEKSFVVRLVDGQLELRYFDFDERDTVIVGDKAVEREFKRMGFLEKEGVFIAFLGATVHTDGRAASVTLLPSLNVDGHSHPAISLEEFKKKFGGVGAYGRNPATTPSTNDRFLFQSVQEGLKAVKAAKAVLEGGKKKPSLKDRKKHGAIETRRFEKMAMRRDQRLKRNVVDAAMAAISTDQSSSSDAAMVGENKAQTSLNKETTAPGGIDFSAIGGSASGGNPNKFNLETQGKGMDPNMPFDPAQLQGVTIDGFTPVIFSITPITNLPLLLGVSAEDSNSPPRT